jgi:hypothetical protein
MAKSSTGWNRSPKTNTAGDHQHQASICIISMTYYDFHKHFIDTGEILKNRGKYAKTRRQTGLSHLQRQETTTPNFVPVFDKRPERRGGGGGIWISPTEFHPSFPQQDLQKGEGGTPFSRP